MIVALVLQPRVKRVVLRDARALHEPDLKRFATRAAMIDTDSLGVSVTIKSDRKRLLFLSEKTTTNKPEAENSLIHSTEKRAEPGTKKKTLKKPVVKYFI